MNRLERMLKDFDENQLREINKFLNSADGRRLKSHINSTDKDKLLQEFSKLDPNEVKKRISGLSTADLMKIMKKLGDDAEDKIKTVMNSLSSADNTSEGIDSSNGLNQIMQIKNIMDSMAVNKNDPRTNLLLSLKPYMREGRKHSIDSAVRLLGLTNVTKMLKK